MIQSIEKFSSHYQNVMIKWLSQGLVSWLTTNCQLKLTTLKMTGMICEKRWCWHQYRIQVIQPGGGKSWGDCLVSLEAARQSGGLNLQSSISPAEYGRSCYGDFLPFLRLILSDLGSSEDARPAFNRTSVPSQLSKSPVSKQKQSSIVVESQS